MPIKIQNKKFYESVVNHPHLIDRSYQAPVQQIQAKKNSAPFREIRAEMENNLKPISQSKAPHGQMSRQIEQERMKFEEYQAKTLEESVQNYKKMIEQAKRYGKLMNDFTKFEEFQAHALEVYIKSLKGMQFPDKSISESGQCVKFVVGKISSGKSSLLNLLLNLRLKVGVGETTLQSSLVYHQNKVSIFDTPGECEQFNTHNIDVVRGLAIANQIFILYPDSLKNVQHIVRVVLAIKPNNTILLRTKCDMVSQKDTKSIQLEIEEDRRVLQKWGINPNTPIYATSSKSKDLYDNKQVQKLLLGIPVDLSKQNL